MRKCRFCGKEIQDASTVCEHCGRNLIPGRVSPAPSPDDVLAELEQTSAPPPRITTAPPPPPSGRALLAPEEVAPAMAPMRVEVVDINMPFASMVGFMVKWALAALPAFLILFFIFVVLGLVFSGFFARAPTLR